MSIGQQMTVLVSTGMKRGNIMYKKEDIINLRHSDYEITPIDKLVYEKFGYVLHQADSEEVVYKQHFGSILNQRLLTININGEVTVEEWYINRYGEKECDFLSTDAEELQIATWKLDEMLGSN